MYLHVGSRHASEVLLKDGQHVPRCGGEGLRIQHAEGAATLENRDSNLSVKSAAVVDELNCKSNC